MEDVKAGRRYAAALFNVCSEEGSVEDVYRDLRFLIGALEKSPGFERYLKSPVIPAERKKKALAERLGPHVFETTLTFLRFLVDKKRTGALPAIFARFVELWNQQQGVLRAKVTTVAPLQLEQKEQLLGKLRLLTGRKVELEEETDPSILGGAIVTYDDRMIDGSVRTQLLLLGEQMRKVRVA